MKRLDDKRIPSSPDEIRLFTMARNEELRLPYFFKYYFDRGVDRIFIIDNGSTDNTLNLALQQDNVHVYQTNETFKKYYNWTEHLLRRHGVGHWCLAVDLDEYMVYPHSEEILIREFVEFLEMHNYSAVYCLLLDMYSKEDMRELSYKQGENPLNHTPFFDSEFTKQIGYIHDVKFKRKFKTIKFGGGMRKRVFNIEPNCTKVPLFKYDRSVSTAAGMHAIEGTNVADIQGVILHFKYLQDFVGRTIEEAKRQEHAGGAFLYKKMANKLKPDTPNSFYYENSVKYKNSGQLLKLGLMTTMPVFEEYSESHCQ